MRQGISIVIDAIAYMGVRGLLYGIGLGAAVGTLLAPIYGTVYGILFGGMVGFPLGITGGIVLGIVTVLFFHPIANPAIYRWTLMILAGLVGFGGAFIGFLLLFSTLSVVREDFSTFVSGLFSNGGIFFYMILALIATGCAIYVSDSYANRYLEQHGQLRKEGIAQ